MKVFVSNKNKKHIDNLVIAIGGGATIDEAKIYAERNKKYCIAIPTTGAGASETTHAVVWGKKRRIYKPTNLQLLYRRLK